MNWLSDMVHRDRYELKTTDRLSPQDQQQVSNAQDFMAMVDGYVQDALSMDHQPGDADPADGAVRLSNHAFTKSFPGQAPYYTHDISGTAVEDGGATRATLEIHKLQNPVYRGMAYMCVSVQDNGTTVTYKGENYSRPGKPPIPIDLTYDRAHHTISGLRAGSLPSPTTDPMWEPGFNLGNGTPKMNSYGEISLLEW